MLSQILGSIAVLCLSSVLWNYFTSPIRDIPGPFLAKFTNLWRLFDVWNGRPDLTQRRLHQLYGSAVRLGPNMVSLSDPGLIKTIYSLKGEYIKSELYSVNDILLGRKRITNLFATRSNDYRNKQAKPIRKAYTTSALVEFEPVMNKTVLLLEQKLDEEFAYTGKTCSLEKWLLYFAWDFMSEITYDDNLGFLKTGGDVQDLIHQIDAGVTYFAVIGQLPALDYLFDKNPIFPIKPSSLGSLLAWTAERMKLREEDSDRHSGAKHRAFIDFFLQLKRDVDWVDDGQVLAWLVINTNAGSDTTAIALAATFYLVLRHPRVHERLVSELRSASPPLPSPVPHTMTSSPSRLQYLNAVVLESTRLHPSLGLILERVVPPGAGLRLADGNVLPPGTIVGMNPHVVQRDKAIFGPDPEVFRPERWLRNEAETEGSWETRKKRMRDADLSFGAGNRACIGKELALMELKKTVATLFKDFDFELANPEKEWRVENRWFAKPRDVDVKLRRRAS